MSYNDKQRIAFFFFKMITQQFKTLALFYSMDKYVKVTFIYVCDNQWKFYTYRFSLRIGIDCRSTSYYLKNIKRYYNLND